MTISKSDRSLLEDQLSLLPILKDGASPFSTIPPHMNALKFYRDADDYAAREIAALTTGLDPEKSLANRWYHFIDLARRSPPLFAPVVAGIKQIVLGLNTEVAYSEIDPDTRWDITQKLGRHIRSVFNALPSNGQDEIDLIMDQPGGNLGDLIQQKQQCEAIGRAFVSLKDSGHRVASLIDHQIRFDSLKSSKAECFDALVLAAELFPVGGFQTSTIRRLERIACAEKNSDWIRPHVQAIGSESDIKYTALFKFRTDTLKMLRSPGEIFLDGLTILVHASKSYAYAAPALPRPTYQPQPERATIS